MSELDEKRQLLLSIRQVLASDAWGMYANHLDVQIHDRLEKSIQPPDQVSRDMREYVAGEIMGLKIARHWLETLELGTTEEITLLKERENERNEADEPDGDDDDRDGNWTVQSPDPGRPS